MSLQLDTLSWFRANQYLLLILNAACLAQKQANTNLIVFVLTQSGLEILIYHIRGEYVNHYTTDAVAKWYDIMENI
jgi:hypothetical protein